MLCRSVLKDEELVRDEESQRSIAITRVHPGERTSAECKPVANSILLSISDEEFGLIRTRLEFVERPHHWTLHEPGQKLEHVYFLNSDMVSLVDITSKKESVEVGVVGEEVSCRLHDIEQRLECLLLLTQDRVGDGLLKITHDFLATMLGTDRPSVSLAAAALQKKTDHRVRYGIIKILNRKRLEATACECYRVIQQFSGDLLSR